jgi:Fungal specific transcription factor domain
MQAYDIMTRNGSDIASVCERCFTVTGKWLPIIDRIEVLVRLPYLRATPSASFSTLVLCMCLYSQSSSNPLDRSSRVEPLYFTAKCFHSILQSTGRISLEVLQAGLLIAIFEYNQGLHAASALTIGICSRMGYSLGLHKTLKQEFVADSRSQKEIEEARRTWWAVFILERCVFILGNTRSKHERRLKFVGVWPSKMSKVECLSPARFLVWMIYCRWIGRKRIKLLLHRIVP